MKGFRGGSAIALILISHLAASFTALAGVFKFTDEGGVTHYVDSESKIPARFREKKADPGSRYGTSPTVSYSADMFIRAEKVIFSSARVFYRPGSLRLEYIRDSHREIALVNPLSNEVLLLYPDKNIYTRQSFDASDYRLEAVVAGLVNGMDYQRTQATKTNRVRSYNRYSRSYSEEDRTEILNGQYEFSAARGTGFNVKGKVNVDNNNIPESTTGLIYVDNFNYRFEAGLRDIISGNHPDGMFQIPPGFAEAKSDPYSKTTPGTPAKQEPKTTSL